MRFLTICGLAVVAMQAGSPIADLPTKYRGKAPASGAVLARVNGVDITTKDVEPLLWEWWGADATQDLISYQVIHAEAQKVRADVNEADVESAIDTFKDRFKQQLQPGIPVDAALAAQGMTRSRLFLRWRTQLLMQKIVERSFAPDKMVKVSTMVFRFANEQASSVADALNLANRAASRLKSGEKWDAVFDDMVKDERAKGSKGLIGWRDLSVFPDSVREDLKKLAPGQVTAPAKTENGMQIFRLEALGKDAKGKDLEELRQVYLQAGQQQLTQRLHQESKIERFWPPAQ